MNTTVYPKCLLNYSNILLCQYAEKQTKYIWLNHSSYHSYIQKITDVSIKQKQNQTKLAAHNCTWTFWITGIRNNLEKERWQYLLRDFIHLGRDTKDILCNTKRSLLDMYQNAAKLPELSKLLEKKWVTFALERKAREKL